VARFRQVWSTTVAPGAFVFTESIPPCAADFELYASLLAMISPLLAFSRNRNLPPASL
jgi:hypothetical protein